MAANVRRPDQSTREARVEDPVEVERVDGGSIMGLVQGTHTLHGQRRVLVETVDGLELETAGERVSLISGQLGRQIRRQVGGDSD